MSWQIVSSHLTQLFHLNDSRHMARHRQNWTVLTPKPPWILHKMLFRTSSKNIFSQMMVSLMVMKISHGRSQSVQTKTIPATKNHTSWAPPPELKMLIKVYPFLRRLGPTVGGVFPTKTFRYTKNSLQSFLFCYSTEGHERKIITIFCSLLNMTTQKLKG